jgi:hypothetical protein
MRWAILLNLAQDKASVTTISVARMERSGRVVNIATFMSAETVNLPFDKVVCWALALVETLSPRVNPNEKEFAVCETSFQERQGS